MRHPESQYLDLLSHILASGDKRIDRTGVGTLSVFGVLARFDLSAGEVPLLTTKKVFWKTAVREMLWFLRGETNIRSLLADNVRIWTDWPLAHYRKASGEVISQDAFESRILNDDAFAARWGELGPVYGKQWRRWQAADGQQHDQIASLVETLKRDPASRRMLFHGWNVPEIGQMALPPCHLLYQYHVTSQGRLNSLLYQRSGDALLGVPFNWAGACALHLMLAQQSGLSPGEFVWTAGDVHLYLNHLDQARQQIGRAPRPLPRMRLIRHPVSIDEYRIDDFEVVGYDPHPPIKADVAV